MSQLHLSYHAHLRRIRRIWDALDEYHCAFNLGNLDAPGLVAALKRQDELERLAWQQFHRNRRRK